MGKQVADGETAGTVGKGLAMEGLRIGYQGFGENPITEGSVIYQAHVSNVGGSLKYQIISSQVRKEKISRLRRSKSD